MKSGHHRLKYHKGRFRSKTKRVKVIERYMRAAFRKMEMSKEVTSAHHFGHVSRVSLYAGKLVNFMGGQKKLQYLARISGYSHDRIRDPTELVSHEERSASYMRELLKKRYEKKPMKIIYEASRRHGELPALSEVGKNIVRDSIVFADKFFEANGAYIAFRRAMFMGERVDRRKQAEGKGWDLKKPEDIRKAAIEFTKDESVKRIKAFSDLSKIPEFMHPFVKYQVEWQKRLLSGLEKGEPGMINLVTTLYTEGLKEKPRQLDPVIKEYKPIAKEDAKFKKEAIDYLDGKLFTKFEELCGKKLRR